MKNLTNHLKKVFGVGLIGILASIPIGCKTTQNTTTYLSNSIESLPSSYLIQSTNEFLDDPELIQKFNELFPNNKPELSYQIGSGKYKSKIFFHPDINLSRSNYEFITGLEVRY